MGDALLACLPACLPLRSFPYNASEPNGPTMGEEVLVFRGFGTEVRLNAGAAVPIVGTAVACMFTIVLKLACSS